MSVFSRFVRPFLRTLSAVYLGQGIALFLVLLKPEGLSDWWVVIGGVLCLVFSFATDAWDRVLTARVYRGLERDYMRSTQYWQSPPGTHQE